MRRWAPISMATEGTRSSPSRLAWGIAIAIGVVFAFDLVLRIEIRAAAGSVPKTVQGALTPAVLTVLGALVASRRPRNPIGWLMLATAFLVLVVVGAKEVAAKAVL